MDSWKSRPAGSRQGDGEREEEAQGSPLRLLSIDELARMCAEEASAFLRQGVTNDRYCLELFRRAVLAGDNDAWASIYQQYAPLTLTWVTQHQGAAPLLFQDGSAPLVNASFAKFFQALTPTKIEQFASLAAILMYLKRCVHSVVTDEVSAFQAHQHEEALESIEHEPAGADPADEVVAAFSAHSLWRVIQEELHDEEERVLVYLAYVQGMKPAEISSRQRRLYPTVADVYRIKRNVLARLRRSQRLRALE